MIKAGQLRMRGQPAGEHTALYIVLEPVELPPEASTWRWHTRWWITTPEGDIFTRPQSSIELDDLVAEADDA